MGKIEIYTHNTERGRRRAEQHRYAWLESRCQEISVTFAHTHLSSTHKQSETMQNKYVHLIICALKSVYARRYVARSSRHMPQRFLPIFMTLFLYHKSKSALSMSRYHKQENNQANGMRKCYLCIKFRCLIQAIAIQMAMVTDQRHYAQCVYPSQIVDNDQIGISPGIGKHTHMCVCVVQARHDIWWILLFHKIHSIQMRFFVFV